MASTRTIGARSRFRGLVRAALARARAVRFTSSCLPEQGRLLEPGGGLVIDDFTPVTGWPPEVDGRVDADRMHWFEHPRLLTTELRLTPTAASLVAVRR